MKRRFPLHVHISTLFLALLLIVGGVTGGLGYLGPGTGHISILAEIGGRSRRDSPL